MHFPPESRTAASLISDARYRVKAASGTVRSPARRRSYSLVHSAACSTRTCGFFPLVSLITAEQALGVSRKHILEAELGHVVVELSKRFLIKRTLLVATKDLLQS